MPLIVLANTKASPGPRSPRSASRFGSTGYGSIAASAAGGPVLAGGHPAVSQLDIPLSRPFRRSIDPTFVAGFLP